MFQVNRPSATASTIRIVLTLASAGALAEDDFLHKVQRAGFTGAGVLHREPLSIDDCALYPLFSDEVIALMRKLIPTERHGRVAVAVVVKAFLPLAQ